MSIIINTLFILWNKILNNIELNIISSIGVSCEILSYIIYTRYMALSYSILCVDDLPESYFFLFCYILHLKFLYTCRLCFSQCVPLTICSRNNWSVCLKCRCLDLPQSFLKSLQGCGWKFPSLVNFHTYTKVRESLLYSWYSARC